MVKAAHAGKNLSDRNDVRDLEKTVHRPGVADAADGTDCPAAWIYSRE